MSRKHILTYFFSFLFVLGSAQETDSTVVKRKYIPNLMVGFDVVNAGMSVFSDRKVFQGFVSSQITRKMHAVADVGFESNIYNKNGYNAEASGPFAKLGAFYMLSEDPENQMNGFYGGGKIGGSVYRQEYFAVPVRGFGGSDESVAFPQSSQGSVWLEGMIGGRVQLFESNFFIDVNVQPRYLVYSSKQENIAPMIVPGFGKSSTKFSFGFAWNVAYYF